MDHGFGWHELWGYWWLFMFFWWFGGMRILGAISHRMRRARRGDAALATLRDRFARGEIDRAEYEERRAVLRGRARATTATATAATPGADSPAWPDLP